MKKQATKSPNDQSSIDPKLFENGFIYPIGGASVHIQVHKAIEAQREFVELCMRSGLVEQKESFGFALARRSLWTPEVGIRGYAKAWDSPRVLIECTVHWGPEGVRYAMNAMRKIRAAARHGMDTIDFGSSQFRDVVDSREDDGSYLWGDFPHGGARFFVPDQGPTLLGGVSALTAEEDHDMVEPLLAVVSATLRMTDRKNGRS